MSDRSVTHTTFTIERHYDASPARVFAAFADPELKARWFRAPGERDPEVEFDFRVGGREVNRGGPPGGPTFTFDARYYDIVPRQRIVYAYEMYQETARLSASLATVELLPAGQGTRLIFTEQGAFFDGLDTAAAREHGTRELLTSLATVLASADQQG